MSDPGIRPSVGETASIPANGHPLFDVLTGVRGERPIVLFFLRAFS